jgi:hypothetical protein
MNLLAFFAFEYAASIWSAFERVAANSFIQAAIMYGGRDFQLVRDNGHREGFSHAVCGYQ